MTTDGWAAAFNLGLALREAFLETYGDESIGRSAKPGVKKGLGKRFARRFAGFMRTETFTIRCCDRHPNLQRP